MRRHPTAAAAAAMLCTLLLATGCSGEAKTSDAGAATPAADGAGAAGASAVPPAPVDPAVAASADAALSGNTKAICDQAARAGTGFGDTFVEDMQLRSDAASRGAAAKAQAKQKLDRDVQNYSFALADMAELTSDAGLKKALTQMSKQVTVLKKDVTKINAEKLAGLSATLDKACGKA
jgi:hypothetical protein